MLPVWYSVPMSGAIRRSRSPITASCFGCIDFYKEARVQGIKPILGCEVYVAPGSRFDRETSRGEDRYYHLVLLAENNTGYQNLMKIVSKGFVEGFYYKRVWMTRC